MSGLFFSIEMKAGFTAYVVTDWKPLSKGEILRFDFPGLKEKLLQAFMQIEWVENDFRNLTAKVWANLDDPIKSYDISKFWLNSCMPPSQVALC